MNNAPIATIQPTNSQPLPGDIRQGCRLSAGNSMLTLQPLKPQSTSVSKCR